MFAGIPSVPTSSQSLEGVHQGTISTVWSVPVCSGVMSGNSYGETHQIDPFGNLIRPSSPPGQSIALSSGLLPYGGQYPYESSQPYSSYGGIATSSWVPMLSQPPRVVYSMQQCVPVTNIPTTPAIVTMSQVQTMPVVCQPQISQVLMQ